MLAEEVALAGVVGFVGPAFGGGVEVVESGFADGEAFGVGGEFGEFGEVVVWGFVDVAGMDSDGGVDLGEFLGDGDVLEGVF